MDKGYQIRMVIRSIISESIGRRQDGYKMIFLAGAPGSGKSTLIKELGLLGFTTCNIDDFFEPALEEHGVSPNLAKLEEDFLAIRALKKSAEAKGEEISPEAMERYDHLLSFRKLEKSLFFQSITKFRALKVEQCNIGANFIVDGTASNLRAILKEKQVYEDAGYDCAMIMVDMDPEVSVQRNRARGEKGGRQLSDFIVRRSAQSVMPNKEPYEQSFEHFWVVSNLGSFPEYQAAIKKIAPEIEKFLEL